MEEGGANLEYQEWLEEALRMEEREPNPTLASPPSLQAKMPIGEEPWRKLEEGRKKEDEESSMTMASQEDAGAKSIPAGAKSRSELSSLPTTKLTVKQDGARTVHEPGHQPNKLQDEPTSITKFVNMNRTFRVESA